VSWYQKGKTNLDFNEARDSEWQWHQLGHMQVCTSLQTDNHASAPLLSFLQAECPSCHPTNSAKALKANLKDKKSMRVWQPNAGLYQSDILKVTHKSRLLHLFNGLFSRITWVSRYQKVKTRSLMRILQPNAVLCQSDILKVTHNNNYYSLFSG